MSVAMIAITTSSSTNVKPAPGRHRSLCIEHLVETPPSTLSGGDYHLRAAAENGTRAQRVECGARRREWGAGSLLGLTSRAISCGGERPHGPGFVGPPPRPTRGTLRFDRFVKRPPKDRSLTVYLGRFTIE